MKLKPEDELKIRRLRRFGQGRSVLSVYLQTEPGLALHHGHEAALLDVLRELREKAGDENEADLAVETERVLTFVRDDYVPTGRTLAIFSSRPRRLFETLTLQLPLRTTARIGPKPYVTPLELALEDHPRVAVALVSEEEVRLMTTVLDQIEFERRVKEAIPGRQRQGGWAAFKYQRDRERHIRDHFRHVVRELQELQRELPYERLVVAGTDEATAAMVKLLPGGLKKKLAGTFREEQFGSSAELAQRASLVAADAERAEELQLSEAILDRALAGGTAVLGWEETRRALVLGKVHRLAISGEELGFERADEALDLASASNAQVAVVHGAAEEVLGPYHGIGALLRY